MLPAAPEAEPALKTTTRTSLRALTAPPLAVVAGCEEAGAAADEGVGVVALLVAAGVAPLPAGPLSITCRSTMPRITARPTSPAPRTAEFTPEPSRPPPRPPTPLPGSPTPLPVGVIVVTATRDPRGGLRCERAGAGSERAGRA